MSAQVRLHVCPRPLPCPRASPHLPDLSSRLRRGWRETPTDALGAGRALSVVCTPGRWPPPLQSRTLGAKQPASSLALGPRLSNRESPPVLGGAIAPAPTSHMKYRFRTPDARNEAPRLLEVDGQAAHSNRSRPCAVPPQPPRGGVTPAAAPPPSPAGRPASPRHAQASLNSRAGRMT